MQPTEPQVSVKVFISYAHADHELHKKLEEHLSALIYSGKITIWRDQEIPAGANWEDQIKAHLNGADMILLLVSSSFIASKYCWNKEVQAALQRHKLGKVRVIPIILRPVHWQETPLGQLQALPTEAKPVTQWDDLDAAFDDVVQGIRVVVNSTLQEEALKKEKTQELTNKIEVNIYPEITAINEDILKIEQDITSNEIRKQQLEAELRRINGSIEELKVGKEAARKKRSLLVRQWRAINRKLLALGFYPEPTHFPPLWIENWYEEDLSASNRAITLNGNDAEAIRKRGEIYREIGRYEEALADFSRVIALNGEDASVLEKRGDIYGWMGQYKEALNDLSRAIALNGMCYPAIVRRGSIYRDIGRYEEALVDLKRVIALNGEHSWAFALRGATYRLMEKYEEALADLSQAIALDEKDGWCRYWRAQIHYLMDNEIILRQDMEAAIELAKQARCSSKNVFDYWMWSFNVALFALFCENETEVQIPYEHVITACTVLRNLRMALWDLNDLLTVQPQNALVPPLQRKLRVRIQELEQKMK